MPDRPATSRRFTVDDVALKHAEGVNRYVVLPASADGRPVAWSLEKLRRCVSKAEGQDATKYEIVGEPWRAAVLPRQKTTAVSRVLRAAVHYAWQADGRCLGAATWDVETAGLLDCMLGIPRGYQLLRLTVNGLPVDAVRRGETDDGEVETWSVPWASLASVSRVELLFFADATAAGTPIGRGRRFFMAPKLGELPVERTEWTIVSPRGVETTIGGDSGLAPVSAENARSGDIAAQWEQFVANSGTADSFAAKGSVQTIVVDCRAREGWSWFPPLAGSAEFLAIVAVAALAVHWGGLRTCFARWPYWFGIAFGLAWWLWLWPSRRGY